GYRISPPIAAVPAIITSQTVTSRFLSGAYPFRKTGAHFSGICAAASDLRMASLLRRLEIAQIGRRLARAQRHQLALGAQAIFVEADEPGARGRLAIVFRPVRIAFADIGLTDSPRPREGIVDGGDVVVQKVAVVLVQIKPLFDDRLIVAVERQA